MVVNTRGFPGGVVNNPPANAGDVASIPGSGRSPGEGNGNPLQYSCLQNPMDRGAWQGTELDMTEHTYNEYEEGSFIPHTFSPNPFFPISKSESEVAWSCPTLCDHMDYSLPGFFDHGIFQARVPEWPFPSPGDLPDPGIEPGSPTL